MLNFSESVSLKVINIDMEKFTKYHVKLHTLHLKKIFYKNDRSLRKRCFIFYLPQNRGLELLASLILECIFRKPDFFLKSKKFVNFLNITLKDSISFFIFLLNYSICS